jgi:hypothetical protein
MLSLENLVMAAGVTMVFIGLGSLVNREESRRNAIHTLLYGLLCVLLFAVMRYVNMLLYGL